MLVLVRRIKPIITKHFEVFVRNMNNQSLDKISSLNSFSNQFIIFVPLVMKSYILPIIMIDTRHSNNRSSQIPSDVFNDILRIGKSRLGINIESIRTVFVAIGLNLFERRSNMHFKMIKKHHTKRITQERIIKMSDRTPNRTIPASTFGKKDMDMRIPLKVTPKGVENANKPGSKLFRLVHFVEHK